MHVEKYETLRAFELKGEMTMTSVLRLYDTEAARIADELAGKIKQAPEFFRDMPVIIDLQPLAKHVDSPPFPSLIELLRDQGLVPIGVRNGNKEQNAAAVSVGLTLLREPHSKQTHRPASTRELKDGSRVRVKIEATNAQHGPQSRGCMVVRPIRSGQQVYAREGDLVVVAAASVGSELLADGNIHVYGPLRGRALAGVNGDESARIFCQSLEAELVAIAGHYQVSEEIEPGLKGNPAQVRLDNDRLIISQL